MKPIEFEQANITFAEDQPEYQPLPAYIETASNDGLVVSCWSLSFYERLKVLFGGKIWLMQYTFFKPLQPQLPTVDSPFLEKVANNRGGTYVPPANEIPPTAT